MRRGFFDNVRGWTMGELEIIATTDFKVDVSAIGIEVVLILNHDLWRPIKNIGTVEMDVRHRFIGRNYGDIVIADTGLNWSCKRSE